MAMPFVALDDEWSLGARVKSVLYGYKQHPVRRYVLKSDPDRSLFERSSAQRIRIPTALSSTPWSTTRIWSDLSEDGAERHVSLIVETQETRSTSWTSRLVTSD